MPLSARSMVLGIVSDRRRLVRAATRSADETTLLVEQARAGAEAGADFYQIREPDLSAAALLALVRRVVDATGSRLTVLVNDRADVAVAAGGGAGVHLRAASMPTARLRAWLAPGLSVTRAVHSIAEACAAGPVDAVVAGTVTTSISKDVGHPTLGTDGLRALVDATTVPVIAIGGLTPADWSWVARTGAAGWAGIGSFLPASGEPVGDAVERAVRAARAIELSARPPSNPARARVH